VRDVFGHELVGAYLHGSAVLGGLRPRSDLDVFLVLRRLSTPAEKRALLDGLLAISSKGPRPVEVTIVSEPEIRPWSYPPSMDFQYGDWLRTEFESGELEPWPTRVNPDLALLVTMVLNGDRTVLGPAPSEILDPVPRRDLVSAMADGVTGLVESVESDTRNVVLTLARMWCTLATGIVRSKDAAADWALAQLPDDQRPVLEHARAVYVGDEDEGWDDLRPRVRPHVDQVVAEIERLVAAETDA
jgi:predicted nucleotidyltransferase